VLQREKFYLIFLNFLVPSVILCHETRADSVDLRFFGLLIKTAFTVEGTKGWPDWPDSALCSAELFSMHQEAFGTLYGTVGVFCALTTE
jgi:hypothetical protein